MNMLNPARERSLQELLHHWPAITRSANDDWTRAFTKSIADAAASRPNWRPSPKQLGIMQRLVAGLFAPVHWADPDDDAMVIE